jgi:hypothetical protein
MCLADFLVFHCYSVTPSTQTRCDGGNTLPFKWAVTVFECSFIFQVLIQFLFCFHIHPFPCLGRNNVEILVWFTSAGLMTWRHSAGAAGCIAILCFVVVVALNDCFIHSLDGECLDKKTFSFICSSVLLVCLSVHSSIS